MPQRYVATMCFAILLLTRPAAAQGVANGVDKGGERRSKAVVPIRSIDPADMDFSDLMPLKERIGDARIVQLGEASHGDGATFLAKCRLVEFLHREMGFDVLVWESGLISCDRLNRTISAGQSVDVMLDGALARPWAKSGQVRPVIEYARSTRGTSSELALAGFDCQEGSLEALQAFGSAVREHVAKPATAPSARAGLDMLADMKGTMMGFARKEPEARQKDIASLQRLIDYLSTTSEAENASKGVFDRATLEQGTRSLLAFLRFMNGLVEIGFNITKISQNNARDAAMADNLIWLANERYKGRKLIVWAASFHLARNPATIDTSPGGLNYEGLVTMGHLVHKALGKAVYTIAAVSHHGQSGVAGRPGVTEIEQPDAGSVEDWCAKRGGGYHFIDLATAAENMEDVFGKSLIGRPLGHVPLRALWADHFDAFLYIGEMFPSTPEGGFPSQRGE